MILFGYLIYLKILSPSSDFDTMDISEGMVMKENSAPPTNETDGTLTFLGQERLDEIQQVYRALGLQWSDDYPGADQYSRHLQRVSLLQFNNIVFTTSGSSSSPFKK